MAMDEELNRELEALTDRIVASYGKYPRLERIGETFLPSRGRIVEIIDEIRRLIFPGYFGHKRLTRENITYHVGNLLVRVAGASGLEVFRSRVGGECVVYLEDRVRDVPGGGSAVGGGHVDEVIDPIGPGSGVPGVKAGVLHGTHYGIPGVPTVV